MYKIRAASAYWKVNGVIISFGLLLLCLMWGGVFYKVSSEKQAAIDSSIQDTGNLAMALEENTVSTLRGLDAIVVFLKFAYEREGKNIDILRYIEEGRFSGQPFLLLSIIDEQGDMVASSQSPFQTTNLSDREHFQVQRQGDSGLHVSKPVIGKVTGQWAIQLSRRINKPDGSFGGIAVVSADPLYFAEFYKQINLGKDSVVTLVGLDGILRVRQSGDQVDIGSDFSRRVQSSMLSGKGYFIDKSIVDEKRRIFSFRTLQNYPLIVAVGELETEALADANQRAQSYYWLCAALSILIIGFCSLLLRDIGKRRQAESELQQLSARLRLATRSGGVGIWDYHVQSRSILWDEQMFALYGTVAVEGAITYENWEEKVLPEDLARMEGEMKSVLDSAREFDTEFRVCWPDKTLHNIRSVGMIERDESGQPVRMIGINWDITQQKQNEAKLQEANCKLSEAVVRARQLMQAAEAANIAKSNFLANMSHEIRTPLNGIMGFLQLLEQTSATTVQEEYIRTIRSSADSLLILINDILDLSKIEADKVSLEKISFDLQSMLFDAVLPLKVRAGEKGLALNLWVAQDVPRIVSGDPTKLKQVLSNLLSNAVKFTSVGEVSLEVVCQKRETAMAYIEFLVRDTGIGIVPEALEKIFKPFVQADNSLTRKYGGTGLGLAISKSIVGMMGGSLNVTSSEGGGSVFSFTVCLPYEPENNGQEAYKWQELVGKKVIVIDDNAVSRQVAYRCLAETGVLVTQADSIGKAMAAFRQEGAAFAAAIVGAHILVADRGEWRKFLSTLPADCKMPGVLVSTRPQAGHDLGFAEVLPMPYQRNMLLACLARVLQVAGEKPANCDEKAETQVLKNANNSNVSILLVDDNDINRMLLLKVLETHGFVCDIAVNGSAAVEACQKRQYDLIFMDCQMPGMDGFEATEHIRRLEGAQRHTPIVALTAYAMTGDEARCAAAGMDDYLSKPIELSSLLAVIEKHVGSLVEKV